MRKVKMLAPAASVLAVWGCAALAQGPAEDRIQATFDRPVQVGSQTLPAGDYTIHQVTSASNPRVLEFTSDNGTKLEATVTTVPIPQNTAPSETKVVLQDEGGGARLAKIWVQGRNYGYAFPGEAVPASQAGNTSARLEGTFSAPAPAEPAVVAQAQPREQPQPQTPAPAPEPPAAPAHAQPAPEPAPAPAPEPMPATGLGWAEVMLAGLSVCAAGLVLHHYARRRAA